MSTTRKNEAKVSLAIAMVLVSAGPVTAESTGMFCQPGEGWTTVTDGDLKTDGWSVVNFTKPSGGELRVVWELDDFDDGPATAGMIFGNEPESIDGQAFLWTDDHEQHAEIQVQEAGLAIDRKVSAGRLGLGVGQGGEASKTLGPTVEKSDLHIFQYTAGTDADGWNLSWRIEVDQCLADEEIPWSLTRGSDIEFLTPDDFGGGVNVQARAHAPVVPSNGAVALVDTHAVADVGGTPYLNTWWANDAGGLELDGPDGLTLAEVPCFDSGDDTLCRGWGEHSRETLTPGTYRFTAEGFTDPTQDPDGETQGPYITLASTELPGGGPG